MIEFKSLLVLSGLAGCLFLKKFFSDVRFFGEKGHSLSVAPKPLAI
jgi:hypothetical protein